MSQTPNTLIIGKVLEHYEKCSSTNFVAKQILAKSTPPDGMVVSTDNQTEGRGQYGNQWQSEAYQNLAFSVILYPRIPINEQFYLSKITSIACVEALNSITNLDFQIKWPNDIYFKNKKVGGLLIENQIIGEQIGNSVVGIGINLNQEKFEGLPQASSIYLLVRYLLNRKKCLEIILEHLDVWYLKLKQGKFQTIDQSYYSYLMGFQELISYMENGTKKTGKLKGVNKTGQLLVEENGQQRQFDFKAIEWVFSF